MHLQNFINNLNEAESATRANYHLTLGDLLTELKAADATLPVVFDDGKPAGGFASYRGYYTDIAINDGTTPRIVQHWIETTETALESVFYGYKGGEYPATPSKPLWRSEYGEASDMAIVSASANGGSFILTCKKVDD